MAVARRRRRRAAADCWRRTHRRSRTAADRAALRQHYVLRVDPTYRTRLTELTARARRGEQAADRAAERHGDARAAVAAADVRPGARRLRRADRAGHAGHAAAILPFASGLPRNRLGLAQWLLSPANPLTARVFVNRYWAMAFGRGLVPDRRGLRQPGPDAEPSRTAGLAGDDVREVGMECQGAAEADRDVGDLPAVVAGRRAGARRRPRQRLAGARSVLQDADRAGARRVAGGQRPAGAPHRRAERLSVPAGRSVGVARGWREVPAVDRRGAVPSQPLHGLEARRPAAIGHRLRRLRAPHLHRHAAAHQHAAAGADPAQRPAVRRERPGARRAGDAIGDDACGPRRRMRSAG